MVEAKDLDFGSSSAEREERLDEWFIETDEFRKVSEGKIDFILGLKGSGKSSIFRILPQIEKENLLIIQGNSLKGVAEYELLSPITGKNIVEDFRNVWKVYLSLIIGQKLLKKFDELSEDEDLDKIKKILEDLGVSERSGLIGFLHKVKESIPNVEVNAEYFKFNVKSEEKKFSYSKLLETEQRFLENNSLKCWVLFDRLDEFFTQDFDKRKSALEGLLFSYSDIGHLENIKMKIFLRTDIFDTLRFENKDHFTSSTIRIKWGIDELMILISKRISKNKEIVHMALGIDTIGDITKKVAENLFYTVFEDFVESGLRQSTTLNWIHKRILDGQGIATPRDMVNFCIMTRDEQTSIKHLVKTGRLISGKALKEAFTKFSEHKLQDYLFSVFPDIQNLVEYFRGSERPKFSQDELRKILKNGEDELIKIRKLYSAGFLSKIGDKPVENTEYFEVPFMYRPILGIKTFGPKKSQDYGKSS